MVKTFKHAGVVFGLALIRPPNLVFPWGHRFLRCFHACGIGPPFLCCSRISFPSAAAPPPEIVMPSFCCR